MSEFDPPKPGDPSPLQMRGLSRMMIRFEGGALDGELRWLDHLARRYCAPVREPDVATAEDFNLIDIDAVWSPPVPKWKTHIYRRDKRHTEAGDTYYVYVFEKEE